LELLNAGRVVSRSLAPDEEPSADSLLVQAAQSGDRTAFEQVVNEQRAAVYGYLRSRLLEPADAEDLCQEVFLRLYLGRERCDRAALLRPWVVGIARNVLREHVRQVKRRKEVTWTELCLELDELIAVDASDRFDEALAHLPQCLNSLGPSARQALELRYQARQRLSDIGQKLCRSEGAVKLLMFRARQALKHCLDFKLEAAGRDRT
jgi:RNA polymerase sigma-70 factor (ECF subfamily)